MLEKLTIDLFAARLGDTFRVRAPGRAFDVELVQVTPLRVQRANGHEAPGGREPFSIVFRGPVDAVVPQRVYPLEHATIGTYELFLVPIGPDRSGHAGMLYEAIFT